MHYSNTIQTISIIGAGNVGFHLAKAFYGAGLEIKAIISKSATRGEELAKIVNAEYYLSLHSIIEHPDLYVIAVPDNQIASVAETLKGTQTAAVHTSGSTGLDPFKGLLPAYGVFYPLQTFTREKEMDYASIPLLIEGNSPEFVHLLIDLAKKVSNRVENLTTEQREKLHIAAVFASNFSNHMATIAFDLLKGAGLSIDFIRPLMEESSKKLQLLDPIDAQTGPAVRGDQQIVEKHLEALKDSSEDQHIYKILTESIQAYRDKKE